MKTLDDVKTFLEGQENGIELYEAISAAILHERNTGKGLVSDERRKNEKFQGVIKKLGYQDGVELDDWVNEITQERETGKKSTQKLTEEQRRLMDLEKKFETAENRRVELEKKAKHSTLKDALRNAFDNKLYAADAHTKALILEGAVDLKDDGKTIVWNRDGAEQDFETGLQAYMEENKKSVINSQSAGGGGAPSDSSAGVKVLNRAAFDKLNYDSRATFFKDGGKLVD